MLERHRRERKMRKVRLKEVWIEREKVKKWRGKRRDRMEREKEREIEKEGSCFDRLRSFFLSSVAAAAAVLSSIQM
jgi:hypothetical protein